MEEIEFTLSNGVKTYTINGCKVKFNPSDLFFAEKLMTILEQFDKEQVRREAETAGKNLTEVFRIARRYDKEMRATLDKAVGAPISQAVAGDVNIYAISAGLPIFVNIILYLWEQIDDAITTQVKEENPRLKKLLAKHRKDRKDGV